MINTNDILLHACCAPCAVACVERLREEGRSVTLFYSNSNIATKDEYLRRLESVRLLADIYQLRLLVDEYDHNAYLRHIAGYEEMPERGERCGKCFGFSLARTAKCAKEQGISGFTTSLSISPHKNSAQIFMAGDRFPGFEAYDFKKRDGFRRSRELARQYDFYLQNYCGCEFSIRP